MWREERHEGVRGRGICGGWGLLERPVDNTSPSVLSSSRWSLVCLSLPSYSSLAPDKADESTPDRLRSACSQQQMSFSEGDTAPLLGCLLVYSHSQEMSLLASDESWCANPSVPPSHLRPSLLRRRHWLACLFTDHSSPFPSKVSRPGLLWFCERSIRPGRGAFSTNNPDLDLTTLTPAIVHFFTDTVVCSIIPGLLSRTDWLVGWLAGWLGAPGVSVPMSAHLSLGSAWR
ncbi:hypothetical protein FQN60_002855, partial [Etheostoma spectabile]